MKAKIFKMAHQLTKKTLQAGDNYQVTFGLVLKMLFANFKIIDTHIQKAIDNGMTEVETRRTPQDGICLIMFNDTHMVNLSKLIKGCNYTEQGQSKTIQAYYAYFSAKRLLNK